MSLSISYSGETAVVRAGAISRRMSRDSARAFEAMHAAIADPAAADIALAVGIERLPNDNPPSESENA